MFDRGRDDDMPTRPCCSQRTVCRARKGSAPLMRAALAAQSAGESWMMQRKSIHRKGMSRERVTAMALTKVLERETDEMRGADAAVLAVGEGSEGS